MTKGDYPSSRIELSDPLPSVHAARSLRRRRDAELGWGVHARSRGRAARPACPFEYACVYRKPKPGRNGDEARQESRVNWSCAKCGEPLIAPEWSKFVSEGLVLNLWTCTNCGNRFETEACRRLHWQLCV